MSEFQREERYIVVKLKHLAGLQQAPLRNFLRENRVPQIECVVVEHDWPEYHLVWAMLEHRMAGKPVPDFNLWRRADELQQRLTAADELNVTTKAELAWQESDNAELRKREDVLEVALHKIKARLDAYAEADMCMPESSVEVCQMIADAALKPAEVGADSCEFCKGWGFRSNPDGADEGCGACNGTGKEPSDDQQ